VDVADCNTRTNSNHCPSNHHHHHHHRLPVRIAAHGEDRERVQMNVAKQLMLDAVACFSRVHCPSRGEVHWPGSTSWAGHCHAAHKKHGAGRGVLVHDRSSSQSSGEMIEISRDFTAPRSRDRVASYEGRGQACAKFLWSVLAPRAQDLASACSIYLRGTHAVLGVPNPVHT
jgi:hypothetical protein